VSARALERGKTPRALRPPPPKNKSTRSKRRHEDVAEFVVAVTACHRARRATYGRRVPCGRKAPNTKWILTTRAVINGAALWPLLGPYLLSFFYCVLDTFRRVPVAVLEHCDPTSHC
jgi:hypothetical protein